MGTLLRVGHLCGEAVSLLQARPRGEMGKRVARID